VATDRPAVVQGDRTVLLEVEHPGYAHARDVLARFAELERSPEHVHTYRLSALALWNAAAQGVTADEVVTGLASISRFELPGHVEHEIRDVLSRHGVCRIDDGPEPGALWLTVTDELLCRRIERDVKLAALVRRDPRGDGAAGASVPMSGRRGLPSAAGGARFALAAIDRGPVKRALLGIGYPVDDVAGLVDGAPLAVRARRDVFTPYSYQTAAAQAFVASGHGVIVLPCGAGKTIVGLLAIEALATRTLILTSNREAAAQWRRELLAKAELAPDQVAIYDGARTPRIGAITIATYAMIGKRGGSGPTGHTHFDRLGGEPWGLVIYDEVHLVPAPVFQLSAQLQARRRLGLTATLVREDGRQTDVFALIGPKRFEVGWRLLEHSGHIAAATCYEVRVAMSPARSAAYALAEPRERPRIAAGNTTKLAAMAALVERHAGERIIVMGTYLEPLREAARRLDAPLVSGATPHRERERIYAGFRAGETRTLVLSRVGNFAIDLPEASVLIQLSGTMGSRQEEAQRLGRILRPKPGGASFYTIVSRHTLEEDLALHRQLFLTEQGYRFFIEDMTDLAPDPLDAPAAEVVAAGGGIPVEDAAAEDAEVDAIEAVIAFARSKRPGDGVVN
jgi:DNA excision repair protein ERCC-3